MEAAQVAMKKCPMCGEDILAVAVKCKHCQSMLAHAEARPPMQPAPAAHYAQRVPARPAANLVRRFWRTSGMFLFGSVPGLLVFAFYGSGVFIRAVGGTVQGHWGAVIDVFTIAFLVSLGALALPAALLLGGALHLARARRELIIAATLGALFGFAFYATGEAVLTWMAEEGGLYIKTSRPITLAALLTAAGGTSLAWWKGRLATDARGLISSFVHWLRT